MNREAITIANDGSRVVATNYFESVAAVRLSALYVSLNAGAFRLLVPDPGMVDAAGATHVVVTRGKSPADGWREMLELLFEDGNDRPFVAHVGTESVDRMPAEADDGRTDLRCVGYGRDLAILFDLPARYRRRPRVPHLKPWGE